MRASEYDSFLVSKRMTVHSVGRAVPESAINPMLFPFQRDLTLWALRKGRAAIFADCVSGDTIIQGPDRNERIDLLAARGLPIRVWALGQDGPVMALASAPFLKGVARLYRFTMADGRSITVTSRHRFLTPRGWQYAGELVCGDEVASCDPIHLQSSSVVAPSMSLAGDPCSQRRHEGSMDHCFAYCRRYGLPLHREAGIGLEPAPSQDDALSLVCPSSHRDDLEHRSKRSHPDLDIGHPSRLDFDSLDWNASDSEECLPQSCVGRLNPVNSCIAQPVAEGASLAAIEAEGHPLAGLRFGAVQYAAFHSSFVTVVSIRYIGNDVYYDMCVPTYGNYLANGVWNHNTGLGKTFMQVEWARLIGEHTLIIAPLSVARQTVREARKIDVEVRYVRGQNEVSREHRIWITNYEMVGNFDFSAFGAVVLDESSILKALSGATRQKLTRICASIPYRLCCTATPAPNDYTELGNHAQFLGICTTAEMLATYFVNANKQQAIVHEGRVYEKKGSNKGGQEWRLKRHAEDAFFRWLASWAITLSKPSDLGYDDNGFILPPLTITPAAVPFERVTKGQLIDTGLHGIGDRVDARRASLTARLDKLRGLVNGSPEQWIVWVGLDDESRAVTAAIDGAVEVKGSDSPESKATAIEAFQDGQYRVMVSKARIAGYGLNLQNACHMAFFGLSDSWEAFYQCIRREWRYRQESPVAVHIVMSTAEEAVLANVMRKDALAKRLREKLVAAVRDYERSELGMETTIKQDYKQAEASGKGWRLLLGDSCERLVELANGSVDLSVFSPPFADLFTYSASDRDLGNSRGWGEFFNHYAFIIRETLRVIKPGRLSCVHTSDIPAMQARDGWIGVKDFPGEVIRAYEREGWIFNGRAFVQKNPQAQAIRIHAKGLAFQQLRKDSSDSRPCLIDQILIFKKPGENAVPVNPVGNGEMDNETWIEWANGIWLGIRETDTLQYSTARGTEDEKHICPLQLGTIERCIKLYSNPGELVLSPFAGIGSEGFQAVKFGRRFIGIELKPEYWKVAVANLQRAEQESNAVDLFAWTAAQEAG